MAEAKQILLFLTDKREIEEQVDAYFSREGYDVAFSGSDLEEMEGVLAGVIIYYDSLENGLKILAKVREQQANSWLPTIFLGHDKMMDPLIRSLEAGADVYVKRPVKLPELKTIIDSVQHLVKESVAKALKLKSGELRTAKFTTEGFYEPKVNELKLLLKPPGSNSISVVRVLEDLDKIADLHLTTEESYLYAKVDGLLTIQELAKTSELGVSESLNVLLGLHQRKVIRFKAKT